MSNAQLFQDAALDAYLTGSITYNNIKPLKNNITSLQSALKTSGLLCSRSHSDTIDSPEIS